jgi:hypothetical protein
MAAASISWRNGDGDGCRGGQEARGMGGGARSRSRRDKDGGGRERGRGSDGSTLLTVRWGGRGKWGQAVGGDHAAGVLGGN